MSTRRQFLTATSAAALASALPVKAFASSSEEEVFSNRNLGAYTQGLLTLGTFQALIGSQFRVFLADGSVAYLTLAAVTDRNSSTASAKTTALRPGVAAASSMVRRVPATPTTTAFDLEFTTRGPALEQKSYTMDHARLGRFAAFLVPAQRGKAGTTYCMSFNYLSAAAAVTASGPVGGVHISQPREASSVMLR